MKIRDDNILDSLEGIPYLQEALLVVDDRSELQIFPSLKAIGTDGISTETWLAIEEESANYVNKSGEQMQWPTDWMIYIPIPKKERLLWMCKHKSNAEYILSNARMEGYVLKSKEKNTNNLHYTDNTTWIAENANSSNKS